eukprot:10973934-Ditylum_brightwellii.AAC.1
MAYIESINPRSTRVQSKPGKLMSIAWQNLPSNLGQDQRVILESESLTSLGLDIVFLLRAT